MEVPDSKPVLDHIRAGVILDDFSTLAFQYEWTQMALSPETWEGQLAERSIDLLFVESAWAGNGGLWRYKLTGSRGPSPEVRDLVKYCRAHGIPTVFWNKEDPVHYGDFLQTAALFDWVWTTDSDRIPAYRRDLGHDQIGTLTFAAQPVVHNPIRGRLAEPRRDVAFAGMFFTHKYPERRAQMEILLGGAMDVSPKMRYGLEIFSRQLGGDERYQFPEPFSARVVGKLEYRQMLNAYKAYKAFLNVNSVVESPTMCARRVFEITAAGSAVVSTPSKALSNTFDDDEIPLVHDRDEAGHVVRALVQSTELRDRMVHKAQRKIWTQHTYAHRVATVLSTVLPEHTQAAGSPTVSMCVSSNRPEQLRHVFATAARQEGVDIQLVLLTHGFEIGPAEIRKLQSEFGVIDAKVLSASAATPLGNCLNLCFGAAEGHLAAKMDDDDYYGPNYLLDQANSLMFSGADLVGKQCHYMYFRSNEATVIRFPEREHTFTSMVMGPTLVAPRQMFIDYPFEPVARGEDTGFLRRLVNEGRGIYSTDRFNYWQMRSGGAHTWQAADRELLASGEVRFYGDPTAHVRV
ncbi:glycosyltransferase family protein [Arthrobacter monumenti]